MRLSKEKIIEGALAFNKAKSFDEFKVLLDLCNIKLEDFEASYYEIASIHPIFANIMTCNGKLKGFSAKYYMSLNPKLISGISQIKISNRLKLPLWFEKDEFETIKILMPNKTIMKSSYSSEFIEDLKTIGIDATKELTQPLMMELGAK